MNNKIIAEIFRKIALILEIKGDNPFRIRAYQNAAQNIESLNVDIEKYIKDDNLESISGIGHDLRDKIIEIVHTGESKKLKELEKSIPRGLIKLLDIPGLGPKTVKLLFEKLKIKNVVDLERALKSGKLLSLEGIKEKTVENIKKGIEVYSKSAQRMLLAEAEDLSQQVLGLMKKSKDVKKLDVAGSLRRQKEVIRDIDILATTKNARKVAEAFCNLSLVDKVTAQGETKSSILTKSGRQVDLRVVDENSYGAALVYFTGSQNFNIKLRHLAKQQGLKVNEYGVFQKEKNVASKTEQDVFKSLGLSYIEPELREDNGEVELAQKNELPKLIGLKDIKGDLHVHSNYSDGVDTIESMAKAAKERGYDYIGICDHSESLKIASGLGKKELNIKKKEIDKVNKKKGFPRVLFGAEVDIDSSGNLDYPDKILKEFDIVIAAIHIGFKQSKQQLTKRIVKACRNKYVHIIAHPTGRLFGVRDAYELDLDEVFKVARDSNTHMEVNSFYDRMDLNDLHIRKAREFGIKFAINTDSHAKANLSAIKYGLGMARRGWLKKEDCINTLTLKQLLKELK